MASKNDENFIAFCDELRAYVVEINILDYRIRSNTHARRLMTVRLKNGNG